MKSREPQRLSSRDLCVPSMGTVQMGFKSPVYEPEIMKMSNQNTSRCQGAPSDRCSERRLCKTRVPMEKNLIRGRYDGASWHNTALPGAMAHHHAKPDLQSLTQEGSSPLVKSWR